MPKLTAKDETGTGRQAIQQIVGLTPHDFRIGNKGELVGSIGQFILEHTMDDGLFQVHNIIHTTEYRLIVSPYDLVFKIERPHAWMIAEGLQRGYSLQDLTNILGGGITIRSWQEAKEDKEIAEKVKKHREDAHAAVDKLTGFQLVELLETVKKRFNY